MQKLQTRKKGQVSENVVLLNPNNECMGSSIQNISVKNCSVDLTSTKGTTDLEGGAIW